MSYIERLKAIILKRGGDTAGIKTVSDAIKVLEDLEKPKYQAVPKKGLVDPE